MGAESRSVTEVERAIDRLAHVTRRPCVDLHCSWSCDCESDTFALLTNRWKLNMSDQKPTNDDILSRIRAGANPAADKPASADAPTANPAEASAPPSGTADILSSIKGGVAAPKPAGTADILSSIKGGAAAAKPKAAAPAGTASILDSIKGGGAPKPAAGAPKGTSSILDSIKGGGAAKPAAAASAGKAAAKPVADTAKAAGLSAADMIKAARTGVASPEGQVVAAESPKKVALPSKPLVKPAAGGAAAKDSVARRSFLADATAFIFSPVVIAWGSLVTATAASSLAMARFMMPNVLV